MSKEFLTPPQNHRAITAIETPYMNAKQEWDSRLGSSVLQAANWRSAFFSLFLITLTLLLGNVYQLMQEKLIPLVVKVNAESGRTEVMGTITNARYEPNSHEVKYFLFEFIRRVRSVPEDSVLIKKNWLGAYMFLRKSAATRLNEIANIKANNPLENIGKNTVSVEIISIVKVSENESYQARWKELVYDNNGTLLDSYIMSAVFSVEFDTPLSKHIFINPLGIFIKHFEWNKEL